MINNTANNGKHLKTAVLYAFGKTKTNQTYKNNESITEQETGRATATTCRVIVEKINAADVAEWQEPWISGTAAMYARNLDGRPYQGTNAIMLAFAADKKQYELPVWGAFSAYKKIGVSVNNGEKATSVCYTAYAPTHRSTFQHVTFDEYNELSADEKKEYYLSASTMCYAVFNVAQTNIKDAAAEKYNSIIQAVQTQITSAAEMNVTAIDNIISRQAWRCEIDMRATNEPRYNSAVDKVFLPLHQQFKSDEHFFGTAVHEMAHSTAHATVLNRPQANLKAGYAAEEITAEIAALLVCLNNSMVSYPQNDSIPYLKAWCSSMGNAADAVKAAIRQAVQAADMVDKAIQENK